MDEMVGLEIAQPCVKTFGPISIPGAGTCVLCDFQQVRACRDVEG